MDWKFSLETGSFKVLKPLATWFIIPLLASLFLLAGSAKAATDEDPLRLVLIHLDGVSTHYFKQELEVGNLPNLERIFGSHGTIRNAITYFPSKTPTVISSLRHATPTEETARVSWAGSDHHTGDSFTGPGTFMNMLFSKSRLGVSNFIYGIPILNRLAGPALYNLPDLLDNYNVLEFYWYGVDTYGHLYGKEPYLQKLHHFDRQFGRFMKRLDQPGFEDVNIIIYSDHGMAFGEGIETFTEIEEVIGAEITSASYPNIYLQNPEKAEEMSRIIVDETSVDFSFFRDNDTTITGHHEMGTVYFERNEEGVRYLFEGEDPFGYYERGYNGDSLNDDQWLELTYDMIYPAAPSNVYNLLSNPNAGTILVLYDDTKYSQTGYSREGNHGGFTHHEMSIPLFVRGPNVNFLQDRQTMWLQKLFLEIEDVPFNHTPSRDDHYLDTWHTFSTQRTTAIFSISPWYRLGAGAEAEFTNMESVDRFRGWAKFDIYRSYLARVWIGSGFEYQGGNLEPMAFIRHELRYHRLTARTTLSTTGNHRFALDYRLARPVSIQVVNFNSAGLRLHL